MKFLLVQFRRLLLAALLAAAAFFWIQSRHPEPPLQNIKAVPDFELTERSGKPVRLSDLKGKVWVADFMYTTCPGPCPMMSSRLSGLQNTLLRDEGVRFVSISTNPAVDTLEVLRGYAEKFHASPDKWLFLTGDKTAIHDLGNKGFLLSVAEQPPGAEEPIVHSTRLALVDKQGIIRGYYDTEGEEGVAKLTRDVKSLLRE